MDLNLLVALHVLLEEESVQIAAERLGLSPSATSRKLTRLREALGDSLLVRAGRRLVRTPRADALRPTLRGLLDEAEAFFSPAQADSLATTDRVVTLRADDALAGLFLGPLCAMLAKRAPHARIRFSSEGEEDVAALRDGRVDLDLGVQDALGPEIRVRKLFRDRYAGVVRKGHALKRKRITLNRLLEARHLSISRRGRLHGPIDEALVDLGRTRQVIAVVPTFSAALLAVARSELVAFMPRRLAEQARRVLPLDVFAIPLALPEAEIALAWHPRLQADPLHALVRECLIEIAKG